MNIIANKLGLSFEIFVAIMSVVHLAVLFRLIKEESSNLVFSLLIFFLNYYVPQFTNLMRQICAMIWGLVVLHSYMRVPKRNLFFFRVLLLGFTFHFSILALCLVPLFDRIFSDKFIFSTIKPFILCIFCFIGSLVSFGFLLVVCSYANLPIVPKLIYYSRGGANVSILAIGVRVLFSLLIAVFSCKSVKESNDIVLKKQYRIYIYGLFLYLLLCQIPIFSRFSDYFTFIEVLLVPNLIYRKDLHRKNSRKTLKLALLVLYFVLFVKDLDDATYQGDYVEHGALNYPYITLFNKEQIYAHRKVDKNLLW